MNANFPALADGRWPVAQQAFSLSCCTSRRRVLLVEDDDRLRACLVEALIEAGQLVTCASTAEQALARPKPFAAPEVLVSDINLGPGLDGVGLAVEARHRWPLIRVILISGVFPNLIRQHLCAPDGFLLKPFRPATLVGLVTELNDAPSGNRGPRKSAKGSFSMPLSRVA